MLYKKEGEKLRSLAFRRGLPLDPRLRQKNDTNRLST